MSSTALKQLQRQPGESDSKWKSRVNTYIRRHAPKEYRFFIRNGKPGAKGQRYILPGVFILLGLLFAGFSMSLSADANNLNGVNGQQGDFIVEDLQRSYTKNAKPAEYAPVVTVRGQQIVPLFSQPSKHAYQIGDTVTLRYTKQGKVTAAFLDDTGKVASPASTVGVIMGLIAVIVGVLIAVFYRGAVDESYRQAEFDRLTK